MIDTAADRSIPTVAVTNTESSALATSADLCVPLRIGEEHTIAAVASYTATLTILALVAAEISGDERLRHELMMAPALMSMSLDALDGSGALEQLGPVDALPVDARGYNTSSACEAALKLKELARVPSEAFTVNEFIHGPIAMIRPSHPIMVIAAKGEAADDTAALIGTVADYCARVLVVSDAGEVLAVVGDNGAGKSTLIKAISGSHRVDEGRFRFEGRPVDIHDPRDASALGIEVVYQDLALCDNLTVTQNMFLGREETNRTGLLSEATMRRQAADTMRSLSVTTLASVDQNVASSPVVSASRLPLPKP